MGYKRGAGPWGPLGAHDLGFIWVPFGAPVVWSPLGPIWIPFGPIWGPFGPIWVQFLFGAHFGPIWALAAIPFLGGYWYHWCHVLHMVDISAYGFRALLQQSLKDPSAADASVGDRNIATGQWCRPRMGPGAPNGPQGPEWAPGHQMDPRAPRAKWAKGSK